MTKLPENGVSILKALEQQGYEGYFVGGCVRDLLLGREPEDWDITTSALPETVLKLFEGYAIPTGIQHGTITVLVGEESFEVTTYRVDGTYKDHRHPESVYFTPSLKEDLKRRDFTINAMAMNRYGEIVDPYGGQQDLDSGVIRCVGAAEKRFREDALRMMRALRFSAVLGFSIEEETAREIHAFANLLQNVSAERIRVELVKLICGKYAVPILLDYADVLGSVLPEILPAVGLDQKNFHHCYTVWEHIVRSVGYIEADEVLRMTMLLHDLGKASCMTIDEAGVGHFRGHADISCLIGKEMMKRLRFDRSTEERVLTLVKWHDIPIEPTERAMRRVLNKIGLENTKALLKVKRADNLAQAPKFLDRQQQITELEHLLDAVLEKNACFSLKQLAINGHDLMALGYQGKEVGSMLRELLNQVIDGKVENTRQALLDQIMN